MGIPTMWLISKFNIIGLVINFHLASESLFKVYVV